MQEATRSGRRWGVWVAAGVVVVAAVVLAVAVLRDDDGGGSVAGGETVPRDVLSGPGTDLAGGLRVADGSSLIGPVVVTGVEGDTVTSWSAVVLVEGDPVEVWEDYAGQLADLYPTANLDASRSPGCGGDAERREWEVCAASAHEAERAVSIGMSSVPGDVTGRYLIRLSGRPRETWDGDEEYPSGPDSLPEPQPARERPGVGGPLAPVTAAYEDDDQEYVVVEGSELLAQYGAGSITGGFAVVLRVRPDADLDAVVEQYIRQADQYDDVGMTEETPPPDVTGHDGTTVSEYHPPGGAGGYTGEVTVVDRPEGQDDYIYFALSND